MIFSKKRFLGFILMFCFLPNAFLQGTPLCDPESDLFKAIPIPARQPATSHHRPTFFVRSLEQALVPTSTLFSQKDQASVFKSALSWAVWPFDLCKKASLCVLKSSWLLCTSGSLLMSSTAAYKVRHPMMPRPTQRNHSLVSLGLTDDWDAKICQGYALPRNQTQRMQSTQVACLVTSCMPFIPASGLCNEPDSRKNLEMGGVLDKTCDDTVCAPRSINRECSKQAQRDINTCVQRECRKKGRPDTGHFSCITTSNNVHDAAKRKQINHVLFETEQCLEPFCQTYAQNACPHKPSWWQSLFGLSACNEALCAGRFVSDEKTEVAPGVLRAVEQIGKNDIRRCAAQNKHLQSHSSRVCDDITSSQITLNARDTNHLLRSRRRGVRDISEG